MAANRMSFSPLSPYREKRPTTNKIIFISCEGSVTEEEYFQIISQLYITFPNHRTIEKA